MKRKIPQGPVERQIALDLSKKLFELGDKGCTDDDIQEAIEKAMAQQRIQTYRDIIALHRNYKGVAHGIDQMETLLAGMIKSEKRLYGLDDDTRPDAIVGSDPLQKART
jgi:hypothetical protein